MNSLACCQSIAIYSRYENVDLAEGRSSLSRWECSPRGTNDPDNF